MIHQPPRKSIPPAAEYPNKSIAEWEASSSCERLEVRRVNLSFRSRNLWCTYFSSLNILTTRMPVKLSCSVEKISAFVWVSLDVALEMARGSRENPRQRRDDNESHKRQPPVEIEGVAESTKEA